MGDKNAVVVLPPAVIGLIADPGQRRWLSRGRVASSVPGVEALDRVLLCLNRPVPESGWAAIRYWGHTGKRPAGWLAAADPVHLRARMRDVVLHELLPGQVPDADLSELFDTVQEEIGDADGFRFESFGTCGYLLSDHPIETAVASPVVANGRVPDSLLPAGDTARRYHKLQGELQMLLHGHRVNRRRERTGLPAINTLWIWGGGTAPQQAGVELPVLYANDPHFEGYWRSCDGVVRSWDGNFGRCLDESAGKFVVVVPHESGENAADMLAENLEMLHAHLQRGSLAKITMFFRDDLTVEIRRRDLLKFWRGISPLLMERGAS